MIIDDLKRCLMQGKKDGLAGLISRAAAYEISGVMAFLSYLEKKCKLAEFFADAGLVTTATSAIDNAASSKVCWLEGEYQSSDGIKKHLGFFMLGGAGMDSLIIEYESLKDGSFKQTALLGKTTRWQSNRSDELSEIDIEQKAERALPLCLACCLF